MSKAEELTLSSCMYGAKIHSAHKQQILTQGHRCLSVPKLDSIVHVGDRSVQSSTKMAGC